MYKRPLSVIPYLVIAVVGIGAFIIFSLALRERSSVAMPPPRPPRATTIGSIATTTTPHTPWVCDQNTIVYNAADQRWCGELPLVNRLRLFQIDLTHNVILFFQHGILEKIFPIAYQAPYGKWFQTPTGYFEVGVKREKFMSSIFPVWMEHAVQLYEDFFIHAIPYYTNGDRVTSKFSGGCIRLSDPVAQDFYNTVQKGDAVVSYLSLDDARAPDSLVSPVRADQFWIRQRFNSPLKTDWTWHEDKQENYIQHTGVDFAPKQDAADLSAYAIASGTVALLIHNGENDGGLGNTVIIKHELQGTTRYALYGHLASIKPTLYAGKTVAPGETLGVIGNTGYGCAYWHIGDDGCDATTDPDIHLHFEIKDSPILASPIPNECVLPSGKKTQCIGYTSSNPTNFGYEDPLPIVFTSGVIPPGVSATSTL